MKCIVYGLDRPTSRVIPTPPAGRQGHVLVRVEAVGLNPVDAKDVMGDKFPHSWKTVRSWIRSYASNKIPGFDFAGTCVERDSTHFSEGDKVFGTMPPFHGSLAEYISVPIDQLCYMPANFSFEQAAALPLVGYAWHRTAVDFTSHHCCNSLTCSAFDPLIDVFSILSLTALQALSPHVSANSSVLVVGGSGGTGHVALQVARCLGAKHITAVCSAKNADFCRASGATEIVDYTNAAVLETLEKSSCKPFNFIMDCVTSADPRDQSMNYPALLQNSRNKGLLTDDYIYRRLGGPTTDWIRAGLERTVGLQLWANKHERLFWVHFPKSSGELRQLQEWAESGKLMPHIAMAYEFTEEGVKEAFDAILSRRVKGKVVVKVH
jgi:reticulon-4-interacting protein 1, mitochondrial